MPNNPGIHHRRSIRLKGYDYSQKGAYFITIDVQDMEHLFGEIRNEEMFLNEYGKIVYEKWLWLADQYKYIELDEWVIMPNHFHGILILKDDPELQEESSPLKLENSNKIQMKETPLLSEAEKNQQTAQPEETEEDSQTARTGGSRTAHTEAFAPLAPNLEADEPSATTKLFPKRKPLGRLIGDFKTVTTKYINLYRNTPGKIVWKRDFYEHIIRNEDDLERVRKYINNNPYKWEMK